VSKELERNQRYIYVLLTGTNTIVAKLIRLYTKKPYSHASIALDMELEELYSFARKQRFNPLNSGFVREYLDKGVFGADRNAHCGVYKIPVTVEQYEHISDEIEHFVNNKDDYGYNYLGLFSAMFGKNIADGTHFMCSQFVYHVFCKGGIRLFHDDNMVVRPFDFHVKLEDKQIYNGNLHEYRDFLETHKMKDIQRENEKYAEAI